MANEIKLHLGSETEAADGVHFGLAVWDAAKRDYADVAGLFASESDARKGGGDKIGTRLVRWTVSKGFVTTRRGLR